MTPDELAARLVDPDPAMREAAAVVGIDLCRSIRAQALRDLHRQLGSWQKVGEAVGLPRQDAWRLAHTT